MGAEQMAYEEYRRTSKPSLSSTTLYSGLYSPSGVLQYSIVHIHENKLMLISKVENINVDQRSRDRKHR